MDKGLVETATEMTDSEFSIRNLMCKLPTVAYPTRLIPSARGGPDWTLGVCDLTFTGEEMSVTLNEEWLNKQAQLSEAAKTKGFFERRAYKVQDAQVKWLREKFGTGLTVPFSEIGKVTGKKGMGMGAPNIKKEGTLVDHNVKFDFNAGEHFWSKSYFQFLVTEAEYASIGAYLVGKSVFTRRLDFQES